MSALDELEDSLHDLGIRLSACYGTDDTTTGGVIATALAVGNEFPPASYLTLASWKEAVFQGTLALFVEQSHEYLRAATSQTDGFQERGRAGLTAIFPQQDDDGEQADYFERLERTLDQIARIVPAPND